MERVGAGGTPSCKSKIRVDEPKKQEQDNRDVMSAFEEFVISVPLFRVSFQLLYWLFRELLHTV